MAARKRSSTSTTNDAQPAARKAKAAARSPRPRPERSARRRIAKARIAELAFEAIAIEGGLLSPEWLARVAQQKAPHQAESDYRVPKGLHLREELGRYWRIAQAHWQELTRGRAGGADPQALATRFVTSLLREVFGFASLAEVAPSLVGERAFPIGHAALGGRVPVVIAPLGVELDDPLPLFGDGQRRRSAFGLAQEYLGAHEGALWGLATSGLSLRILRDNPSLTRPAWVGVDLARIFTEERYADFAALWLLLHESRFGRVPAAGEAPEPASACPLEAWREAGRAEGTRAREHLRLGVEEALVALGQGFLAQADNAALREALSSGQLSLHAYFQELLRLVYRLIFLLAAEERGVLHPEGTSPEAAQLYEEGYGLRRLRDRAVRRSAHDRHGDLWESLKITLRALARGEPRLGLPALAGLFAPEQCPHLDGARLPNAALLLAVYKLAWLRQGAALERVNWRDMGPEELGSVYESLLELVPQLRGEPKQFGFATGGEAKGHARKTTGSYYTPDSLVQVLLDSALEPVVAQAIAANPGREAEALLELAIVDPACGSGHFLLSAARRLAAHVARLEANGTPSVKDYRHALRRVVGRCIYGVDLNPMAVELCKVALWMEAVEPGLPLGFLDAHVQQGNALLGTTPELMKSGIPDAAWEPIEGDDKKAASALKKKNKAAAKVEYDLFASRPAEGDEAQALARAVAELEAQSDSTPEALAKKESQWEALLASEAYQHQKLVADAWCAAFVWPKQPGELTEAAPTNELWRQLRDQKARPPALTVAKVRELATQYRFFHWHLQFPQVFQRGGFDVVLGNPPWDSVRFNEEEFFAGSRPEIAQASTASARKKLVARLAGEDPTLFSAYRAGVRKLDGINAFVRSGVRYPLCGVGRVNLFALFAEAGRSLVNPRGRVGQILPSGIVADDSTKLFFQSVVEARQLMSFFDFENREGLFPAIDSRIRFGILTLTGIGIASAVPEFVFFATRAEHLKDSWRQFTLSADDIELVNPGTKTCPIFRSGRDAETTKSIYRRVPVLTASGWRVEQRRLINQSDDSGSFLDEPGAGRLPLYEGKYFHHYDHRWLTNSGNDDRSLTDSERTNPTVFVRPRHWYPAEEVQRRFGATWKRDWVFAWRDITNATNERTFIASVVPSLAVPNTARVVFPDQAQIADFSSLIANFGAFALDFVARQKIGGTHMSGFIVDQLPVLAPSTYEAPSPWQRDTLLRDWILPRVLELTYTAWDLEAFGRDVGYDGPPFRWDPARRFLLRCELDAAFFHLYGLPRDDVDYVMDTFPIVRKNDEKAHGEYRTKRVILEIYDAMAQAAATGVPYATRLDPPPADARVAHAASTRPEWAKRGEG